MKKLSSKMKILLVLAICTAFIVPSVASADSIDVLTWESGELFPGEYILDWAVDPFKGLPMVVEIKVDNGDQISGKYRVSSVKIEFTDGNGKNKEVIISPNQFDEDVGSAKVTLNRGDLLKALGGVIDPKLRIKVSGKKTNYVAVSIGAPTGVRPSGW